VQESIVPTNDMVACDIGASRSQRKDMTVDFVVGSRLDGFVPKIAVLVIGK
jgi:hypothetical protein